MARQNRITEGLTTKLGYSQPIVGMNVLPDGLGQTGPVVIPAVPIGMPVTHFTLVFHNAVENNSQLILYIDDAEGLPFTPNGLDMVIQPDWLQGRGWWRP